MNANHVTCLICSHTESREFCYGGDMASLSNSRSSKCPFSGCIFEAMSMSSILSHIRLVHASDPNFSVPCGIEGCCKTNNSFSALYQHIYKKHKNAGVIQARGKSITNCSSSISKDYSADTLESVIHPYDEGYMLQHYYS